MAVLSVQSRVVAGYAGNSAAVFCLQRAGVECWGLDTLQFSNHTGYAGFAGRVFQTDQLRTVYDGLKKYVGLKKCRAVLSGYLGKKETGSLVLHIADEVRGQNPSAVYCCDPVLGDDGEIYVTPDIPAFMREKVLPAADIITPNRFELSVLSQRSADGEDEIIAAARSLLKKGRPAVCVVTGITVPSGMAALAILESAVYKVVTPFIENVGDIGGAGDMTTALFLAEWLKSRDAPLALSKSVSSAFGVIRETAARRSPELCLIEAQGEIQTPSVLFSAKKI